MFDIECLIRELKRLEQLQMVETKEIQKFSLRSQRSEGTGSIQHEKNISRYL
jgi:hypothetical protein